MYLYLKTWQDISYIKKIVLLVSNSIFYCWRASIDGQWGCTTICYSAERVYGAIGARVSLIKKKKKKESNMPIHFLKHQPCKHLICKEYCYSLMCKVLLMYWDHTDNSKWRGREIRVICLFNKQVGILKWKTENSFKQQLPATIALFIHKYPCLPYSNLRTICTTCLVKI